MACTRHVSVVILMIGFTSCHRSAAKPSQEVAARVAMDSATIERLCAHPDSVRAGLAECVLKDQSPSPDQRLKPLERPTPP